MNTDPRAALKAQLDLMQCMLENVQAHVDAIEEALAKPEVSWADTVEFNLIVDLAKRSDFI